MQTSIVLARLLGPILIVIGAGLLLDPRAYRALSEEFLASRALVYISGLMALTAGLAIVNFHNVWAFGWPVIITLLGWLMLIGGVVRVLAPDVVKGLGRSVLATANATVIAAVIAIVLGAILAVSGYFR